jgi:hypothetical protein
MFITINGKDTIKTLASGQYRAHRLGTFWIGDYATFASANRALQIANSKGNMEHQRGFYDGGVNAIEEQHAAAHLEVMGLVFGHCNCVTEDDVARTILAGEPCRLQGCLPVRA